ncbi:MAG: FkbM family methyltransferase [Sulfuricella sp.]|nr:FkbM family methyltransferase [Sulfuricella sp.]
MNMKDNFKMPISPYKTKIFNFFRLPLRHPIIESILISLQQMGIPFVERFFPSHFLYVQPAIRDVTRWGIKFTLDISDYVDWLAYYKIEDVPQDRLMKICKHGDIVFDVGVNIGVTALKFAKKVGVDGLVIGFEPDKLNYSKFLRNAALNEFTNIEVYNDGLSDHAESVLLCSPNPSNRGENRVTPKDFFKSDTMSPVALVTLDEFMKKLDLDRLDLIKIDVEGYEIKVIKGARETIRQHHPRIFMELDDRLLRDHGGAANELLEVLEGLGYRIQNAETLENMSSNENYNGCHIDVLCQFENASHK